MLLRTKIFRHLLLFALVPSLLIAVVFFYLQSRIVAPADRYIASFSPDRIINALRLGESRLQETARSMLTGIDPRDPTTVSIPLDWMAVIDSGIVTIIKMRSTVAVSIDSLFGPDLDVSAGIRRVIGRNLFIGACVEREGGILAGGFALDHQYLDGFESATVSLSQRRFYTNLRPAFTIFSAATGAAVLVIVIGLAWVLSRRLSASVTTSLERLAAMTAAVARGERPAETVPAATEEIRRLRDTFQKMLADLDENRARLMAAERVAAWQEFARRLAHELKNPLTPLALSVYRLRNRLREGPDYDRCADPLDALDAEVAHLKRLADDYSSLAHLPEPKFIRFRFDRLVQELVELHATQLERFRFDNRCGSEPVEITGDPDRLREVIVNLVKNALEFARPDGRIIVETARTAAAVRFLMANENRDDAPSADDLQQATRPYVTTRPGGTGLGLAISEKIIIDHGGRLKLETDGRFTQASFELPVDGPPQGASV